MRTNDLRKLIKANLDAIDENAKSYFKIAPDDALYPHIVFELNSINLLDLSRDDYELTVTVWDRNAPARAEELADKICDKFNANNQPTSTILPTFFRQSRAEVIDADKTINEIVIKFDVLNYER